MHTTHSNVSKAWHKLGGAQAGTIAALALPPGKDSGYSVFIGTKVGLYRSSRLDGLAADDWERLANAPIGIMSLAVSPAFAQDHTVIAGTNTGIYVSTDAGATWQPARIPFSQSMILSLGFSPHYAEDSMVLAGTLEDGVWVSATRGERWAARSFGLLDATVFCLALSPNFAQDETIYAGTDSAIYYSYNGARAWKRLNFPESAAPVLSLALSPDFATDQTLYAGTEQQGLYRSVDRGARWERLNLPAASVNALLASRDTGLLATTEAGIFQSQDQGQTWRCIANIPDAISLAATGGAVIAGCVDLGLWMAMTANLGDWQPVSIPPVRSILGMTLSPHFERDGSGFMYGPQEGIWRTTDGGATWNSINAGLPSLDIHALVIAPPFNQDHTLVATSPDGVFLSADAGEHWQVLASEPAGMVAFSPDGKRLAVAFSQMGLRFSEDLGQTWQSVPGPWDTGGQVAALALPPGNDQYFRVALLSGADNRLSLWQGRPGQFVNVLNQPTPDNPVVCLWIPGALEMRARVAAHNHWYASLGRKVWTFNKDMETPIAESELPASMDAGKRANILALAGVEGPTGQTLFACTSQHLYISSDGASWRLRHDFGSDTAIGFAPSPAYTSNHMSYALLLGGTFCRGTVGMVGMVD